jgi:gluconate 2-dehydrogenase subunit 3-like protein
MIDSTIQRRTLLQLASASLLTERLHVLVAQTCTNANHRSTAEAKPYTVQFFSPEEMALLDRAMEFILPADDHSPGAHEAQTSLFADLIISNSSDDVKQDWRAGLRLLAAELATSTLSDWLNKAAANEYNPQSALDLFFAKLKQMTIEGYYTSRIGIDQDLQYQGNTYLKDFKGCTDVEHQI